MAFLLKTYVPMPSPEPVSAPQAGSLESLQCLPHRRARDPEPFRELLVAQPLPRRQPAVEDRLSEPGVHLVAEDGAARLDGDERS